MSRLTKDRARTSIESYLLKGRGYRGKKPARLIGKPVSPRKAAAHPATRLPPDINMLPLYSQNPGLPTLRPDDATTPIKACGPLGDILRNGKFVGEPDLLMH